MSSTDAAGIVGVLAWKAYDEEGRTRFVSMKAREATVAANVKLHATMRARQDEEHQELHEIIEFVNETRERLMSTMKRKRKLMGEVPRAARQSFHETRVLVDRISAEEWEMLEKKQAMKEFLKGRRRPKGVGETQMR